MLVVLSKCVFCVGGLGIDFELSRDWFGGVLVVENGILILRVILIYFSEGCCVILICDFG